MTIIDEKTFGVGNAQNVISSPTGHKLSRVVGSILCDGVGKATRGTDSAIKNIGDGITCFLTRQPGPEKLYGKMFGTSSSNI